METLLPWLPTSAQLVRIVVFHNPHAHKVRNIAKKVLGQNKTALRFSKDGCALSVPNPQTRPGAQKLAEILDQIKSKLRDCSFHHTIKDKIVYIFCTIHMKTDSCSSCSGLDKENSEPL